MSKSAALTVLVIATLVAAPAAGASPEPGFLVSLQEDGDARITLTTTFDLTDEDRRQAFQSLADNESARRSYSAQFAGQLSNVASATSERTGRNMTVENVSLSLDPHEDTGVARVSATWTNLAAQRDGDLVVTEPFASGFSLDDRKVVVTVPDEYGVSVTPAPDDSDGNRLVWAAGTDLSGFQLTATPPQDGGSSTGIGPGVGAVGALAALLVATLAAARRRS